MDLVEISYSQHNQPIALRLRYIYNLQRSSSKKQDWRCKEFFKKKCTATNQTKDDILLKSKNFHVHYCDPDEASAHMAYSKLKEDAKSMLPSELPGHIVGGILSILCWSVFYVKMWLTFVQTMRQNYRKNLNPNRDILEKLCEMHKL